MFSYKWNLGKEKVPEVKKYLVLILELGAEFEDDNMLHYT